MDSKIMIDMTRTLTLANGVAGREKAAAEAAATLLRPLGEVHTTTLGSVWCTVCPGTPNAPHLVLEAHLDQIGLAVTKVEENGFLRIGNIGGFDRRTLPAAPVTIHGTDGDYPGVICSVPPHLASKDAGPLKMEEFAVDTGYSTEEAKKIFAPGDVITLDRRFAELANETVASGAMDDRIGCVAVIAAAQELHQTGCNCRVSVLLSAMEEVGGHGAATAGFVLRPDLVIAVDVSFAEGVGATTPTAGKLGGGVMIGIAPILDNGITDDLLRIAKEKELPFQYEVMGGRTGTDADSIAVSAGGIRSGLLSIPLRNMHTPVETVRIADVMTTAQLMVEFAKAVV